MKLLCKKTVNNYIVKGEYYKLVKYNEPPTYRDDDWTIPIRDIHNDWYYNYSFTDKEIKYYFYTIQELKKEKLCQIIVEQ